MQNAAEAENYGVEANLIYQLSDSIQLRAALSYATWSLTSGKMLDVTLSTAPDRPCYQNGLQAATSALTECLFRTSPVKNTAGHPLSSTSARPTTPRSSDSWGLEASFDTIHHSDGERVLNQPYHGRSRSDGHAPCCNAVSAGWSLGSRGELHQLL